MTINGEGPGLSLGVLCNGCGRALANVGEWCCGRFTSQGDVTTVEPSAQSWLADRCPVCTSDDLTVPSGPAPTRCRSCGASWSAAARVCCHVRGCVRHLDGMHVDEAGDAVVHVGCGQCVSGVHIPEAGE